MSSVRYGWPGPGCHNACHEVKDHSAGAAGSRGLAPALDAALHGPRFIDPGGRDVPTDVQLFLYPCACCTGMAWLQEVHDVIA